VHRIGVHELNWQPLRAGGGCYLLEHELQLGTLACFKDGLIADLVASTGGPSEKIIAILLDSVTHVGICAKLIDLMIKSTNDVFPRLLKHSDSVLPSVGTNLGIDVSRVIKR
jgi:hypothetical protein